jgi:SAM-dependent methyltransferase
MQNTNFYEEQYYKSSGYARIIEDEDYYYLLSEYWKYIIFTKRNLDPNKLTLDYGCGLGQVSASLPNVTYFDTSNYAANFLTSKGKNVITSQGAIPDNTFDYILSSHSLEHSPTPTKDLREFHKYLKPKGKLLLIIPVETQFNSTLIPDHNQHLQCWTFQTITNLLFYCGWKPTYQSLLNYPFLLNTLSLKLKLPLTQSIRTSAWLGEFKKASPSMFIFAEKTKSINLDTASND